MANSPATNKLKIWVNGSNPEHPYERTCAEDRGTLFQLVNGQSFCHLVVIECPVFPGAYRGRHFHRKKQEEFFLATGQIFFAWYDLETEKSGECELPQAHA